MVGVDLGDQCDEVQLNPLAEGTETGIGFWRMSVATESRAFNGIHRIASLTGLSLSVLARGFDVEAFAAASFGRLGGWAGARWRSGSGPTVGGEDSVVESGGHQPRFMRVWGLLLKPEVLYRHALP